MESLQLLKFLFKKEHLNFMEGWVVKEDDLIGAPKPTMDHNENHNENIHEDIHEDMDEDTDV